MAIQIRRGTNTEWESNNSNIVAGEPAIATDAERFFVGTASGDYAEFANLDIIAPAYDTTTSYVVGDIINYHGKLYSCNAPCSGAFNIGYWNETSLTEILKDLENEIDYAQYEIGYASGKLITINNGASEIPVKDLTLDIEAVQDLHGYDHPWVGGAGKNKLEVTGTSTTTQGITFNVSQDGTITVSGTFQKQVNFLINATCYLKAGDYIFNGVPSAPSWTTFQMYITVNGNKYASVSGTQFTVDTDGEYPVYLSIYGAVSGTLTFKPMIRLATETDATFAPYSNICPISGWDEVNVVRTGKNLFSVDKAVSDSALPSVVYKDGEWLHFMTGGERLVYNFEASKQITFSAVVKSGNTSSNIIGFSAVYSDGTSAELCRVATTDTNEHIISGTSTEGKFVTQIRSLWSDSKAAFAKNIQIEFGSTATSYEPYNGATYTTAVNVWDEEWEVGDIDSSTGQNVSNSTCWRTVNYISVLPNTTYYSASPTATNNSMRMRFYDSSKNYIGYTVQAGSSFTNNLFTTPNNAYYMRFAPYNTEVPNHDISINFPADNTKYIPFKGAIPTQNYMDTFGHGVYGGTLDVTTGVLTITHGFKIFNGTETWGAELTTNFYSPSGRGASSVYISGDKLWCSHAPSLVASASVSYLNCYISTTGNFNIQIPNSIVPHTATDMKSWVTAQYNNGTPLTIRYELVTPQVVQLTPTQVRTVLGTNNLWNQMNSNNELAYRISNALN